MFTYKQFRNAKHRLTQAQRAQLPDEARAKSLVMQAIREALVVNCLIPEGLHQEDLDRIFDDQPMYFDGLGYVPHYFQRQDIKDWGEEMCYRLYPKDYEDAVTKIIAQVRRRMGSEKETHSVQDCVPESDERRVGNYSLLLLLTSESHHRPTSADCRA